MWERDLYRNFVFRKDDIILYLFVLSSDADTEPSTNQAGYTVIMSTQAVTDDVDMLSRAETTATDEPIGKSHQSSTPLLLFSVQKSISALSNKSPDAEELIPYLDNFTPLFDNAFCSACQGHHDSVYRRNLERFVNEIGYFVSHMIRPGWLTENGFR